MAGGMVARRPAPASVALLLGLGLFLAAWVGANPPGAAPDEAAQFTKAVGTATGQGIGRPLPQASSTTSLRDRFLTQNTRTFALPTALRPDPRWACESFTTRSAACVDRLPGPPPSGGSDRSPSLVGRYPEASYVPIGLAARLAGSPDAALYAGRAAGAAVCLALLAIAVFAFADPWLRLGLVVVISPMVLFLAGSVTTSGVEVCAGIAQAATLLALVRRPGDRRAWLGYGVSGVALAVTRQFGPVWVVADLCLAGGLLGWRGTGAALRRGGRAARAALAAVGIAALTTVAWDAIVLRTVAPPLHVVVDQLAPAVSQSYRSLPQLFGVFGWLDTRPPAVASDLALAVYALVLVSGLVLGTRRQRVVLAVSVITTAVGSVAIDAVTQLPFGFGLQARYVMPLSAMTLLLAAWIVHQRVGHRPVLARRLPVVLGVVLVADLGLAWLASSRQAAVGAVGPRLFFRHPRWVPPAGWGLWIVVAAAGGLVLLAAVGDHIVRRPAVDRDGGDGEVQRGRA
jgi:hypothetical protein